MFDHTHYVPILRWKRAEMRALRELSERVRNRITPLVELIPRDFAARNTAPAEDPEQILSKTAERVQESWGQEPLFIDLLHLDPSLRTSGGIHPVEALRREMRSRQLSFIPVTGLRRDPSYQSALAAVIQEDAAGLCLRLHASDLRSPSFAEDLEAFLSKFKLPPSGVDLLVDCQAVVRSQPYAARLCSTIPDLCVWRTFTFASGAFPQDLTEFSVGQHRHPRGDWLAWREHMSNESFVRHATFGDYTIQHGAFLEPPSRPNISASIRYTTDEHWVIMRGEGLRNKDGPRYDQYPANAELLCGREEYCGENFSYGDAYIHERYENPQKTGSPETWLRAGINHHMAFVVHQIAEFFDTSIVGAP